MVSKSGAETLFRTCRAQGIVQHATINNLAFGRNVTETLRILQAIQYVQENPDEVGCSPLHCHQMCKLSGML